MSLRILDPRHDAATPWPKVAMYVEVNAEGGEGYTTRRAVVAIRQHSCHLRPMQLDGSVELAWCPADAVCRELLVTEPVLELSDCARPG